MDTRIEVNDDHELYVWARILKVTPQELVRVVGEVGSSPERVRDALKRSEIGRSGGRHLQGDSRLG
jgi:hypothetical protein